MHLSLHLQRKWCRRVGVYHGFVTEYAQLWRSSSGQIGTSLAVSWIDLTDLRWPFLCLLCFLLPCHIPLPHLSNRSVALCVFLPTDPYLKHIYVSVSEILISPLTCLFLYLDFSLNHKTLEILPNSRTLVNVLKTTAFVYIQHPNLF